MSNNLDKSSLLEPLKIALALEIKGKEIFVKAASETNSKIARQTFEFLAAEEDKHISNIEKFYQSLESSKLDDLPEIEDSQAEEKLESFNLKLEEFTDEFQSTSSDIEAYQLALKFEGGAEEFYEEKYNEAQHPKVKKFYKWLIDEETMHSRLINSCLKFVEDPAEWFSNRKKI